MKKQHSLAARLLSVLLIAVMCAGFVQMGALAAEEEDRLPEAESGAETVQETSMEQPGIVPLATYVPNFTLKVKIKNAAAEGFGNDVLPASSVATFQLTQTEGPTIGNGMWTATGTITGTKVTTLSFEKIEFMPPSTSEYTRYAFVFQQIQGNDSGCQYDLTAHTFSFDAIGNGNPLKNEKFDDTTNAGRTGSKENASYTFNTTYKNTYGVVPELTVRFDANEGAGAPADMTVTIEDEGVSFTIPAEEPARDYYLFQGWALTAEANEAAYKSGDTVTLTAAQLDELAPDGTLTLYAVWEKAPAAAILNETTEYPTLQSALDALTGGTATIRVLRDLRESVSLSCPAGLALTLNLDGNTVTSAGAAVMALSGQGNVTIQNGTLAGAGTVSGNGGALNVSGGLSVSVQNVAFANNAVTGSGGAIYVNGAGVTVTGGSFSGNKAQTGGDDVALTAGSAVTLPGATAPFTGWYEDGPNARFSIEEGRVTERTDASLYLKLAGAYQITLDLAGGKLDDGEQETWYAAPGSLLGELPVPSREEYEFLGWFIDADEATADTPVTSNLTLTAQWEAIPYVAAIVTPEAYAGKYETLQAAVNAATKAAANASDPITIQMLDDTAERVSVWPNGGNYACVITLDLAGHTVGGTGTGSVFYLSCNNNGGLTFIVDDTAGGGMVTGGTGESDRGGSGGAFYLGPAFTSVNLVINGGTITGNTATNGGAVYAYVGHSVTVNGGTITGNRASGNGGAIYGNRIFVNGGTITGNQAGGNGGGLCLEQKQGSVNLDVAGGAVCGNTAGTAGDDLWFDCEASNITGMVIHLIEASEMSRPYTGWYTDGADARFTLESAERVPAAQVTRPTEGTATYALKAADIYTVTFAPANGEAATSREYGAGDKLGQLPAPKRDGYSLKGWFDGSGSEVTAETAVKGDMTLTAKWTLNVTVDGKTVTVDEGTTFGALALEEPTKGDYFFAGWTVNGKTVEDGYVLQPGDVIEAIWEMTPVSTTDPEPTTGPIVAPTPTPTSAPGATTSPEATAPKTGDESNIALWIALGAVCMAGLGAVLVAGRKQREK